MQMTRNIINIKLLDCGMEVGHEFYFGSKLQTNTLISKSYGMMYVTYMKPRAEQPRVFDSHAIEEQGITTAFLQKGTRVVLATIGGKQGAAYQNPIIHIQRLLRGFYL
jgi:hypothetical protein